MAGDLERVEEQQAVDGEGGDDGGEADDQRENQGVRRSAVCCWEVDEGYEVIESPAHNPK